MLEWTLGITDSHPSTWRSAQPHWNDERMTASTSHTFRDVMSKLCATAIKGRREVPGDHGIGQHLWNMKVVSLEDAMDPRAAQEGMMQRTMDRCADGDSSNDDEDDSDDGEGGHRRNVTILCPDEESRGGYEDFDDADAKILSSDTKLCKSILPEGHVLTVTYDYGTTTTLYLKVLSVKEKEVKSLLQYFVLEADSTKMEEDLKAVPAYNLQKDEQVDSHFPHASKAFLGCYIPLFTGTNDENNDGDHRKVMGCITLGLSAKLRSEEDTIFCSMENRTQSRDLMFCPGVIEPNELLEVVNKAWEPRDKSTDEDNLERYRYDWIDRWLVASDNDEEYDRISEMIVSDLGYGSKKLLFRLARERKKSGFDFQKTFPKTYEMLTCGKFRWIQYKKDVLRVVVGRGVGRDDRQCESNQVLRTWKREFASFHELLCAVEASWVWKGEELTSDVVLPEFDTDLGPSKPLPKEPPCVGKERDAIVITKCGDKKKLVTALAISEEANGKPVLYSGHDDGVLTKWSLDDGREIWSKRIYPDGTADYKRYEGGIGICIKETPGVAGIAVRPDLCSKSKQAIVYTWSDAYHGYPDRKFDQRGAARLKAWSGLNGAYLREYVCDVGDDEDGSKAYPSISTVVFCKVTYEDFGEFDSIIVGLHCCCNHLEYDDTYSDFDLEEARDFSEGNIIPFLEHSRGRDMPSWRGQGGMIRAMAVVGTKYLASFSIRNGHGLPDAMVLWSLEEAGVPLFKRDFWDHRQRNVLKQQQSRLSGIDGISIDVDGSEILLADNSGDRIAAVTVDEDDDDDGPSLKLRGLASMGAKYYEDEGFHGRMAMSKSRYGIMAMEINQTTFIFQVEGTSYHKNIDRRDGNRRHFRDDAFCDEDDHEALKQKRAGREVAVAKVQFPPWGGNKPKRSKKRGLFGDEVEDTEDGLGRGGPVQLAMRGRHAVAGFTNGSLVRFWLPDEFEESHAQDDLTSKMSSNHLACSCSLPSDEWHVPILDFIDD